MARKESNMVELKLERVGKKVLNSEFNSNLKQLAGHPVSVSVLKPLSNESCTAEYQLIATFGKMYVGESFTSCLMISNTTESAVLESISISCCLKYTGMKSYPQLFQTDIPKLLPSQVRRFAFSLIVSVPDVYYLNLQVKLSVQELPEPVSFGKLFKFEAKAPLECKNTVFKADSDFFVQCQLTNNTIYPMQLQTVEFRPMPGIAVHSLHELEVSQNFNSGDVTSYLYQLSASDPLRANVELGHLVISWYNNTGDVGNVTSQGLTHSDKPEKILKVQIQDLPEFFQLEIPRVVSVEFCNLSNNLYIEGLCVHLESSLMRNLVLTPLDALEIGRIKPQKKKALRFCVFPKTPGIHALEGLRVSSGTQICDYDSCKIYVKH